MATIGSGLTSLQNTSRRSYLSVAPFNNDLYVYSTYINANRETKGTFVVNPAATSSNCPKGNVLHENGRKLVPGAYPGVTTYMVGVYDPQSLLSGFIDPNSPLFASYNTDKPNFITPTWGVDPGTGGGSTNDLGAPVYTNGTVEARGNITSDNGNIIASTGNVQSYSGMYSQTGQNLVRNIPAYPPTGVLDVPGGTSNLSADIDISKGQVIKINLRTTGTGPCGFKINAVDQTNVPNSDLSQFGGAQIYFIIFIDITSLNATAGDYFTFKFGSRIYENQNGSIVIYRYDTPDQAGTFTCMFVCDGVGLWQMGTISTIDPNRNI
jgi:hypothetical protein